MLSNVKLTALTEAEKSSLFPAFSTTPRDANYLHLKMMMTTMRYKL